jgi:polyisoprenoid-binding protein YceI
VTDSLEAPDTDDPGSTKRSSRRIVLWVGVGIVGLIALVYGAIFVYANVINDSPDELDERDLSAALADDTVPETTPDTAPEDDGTTAATTPEATTAPATTESSTESPAGFDGDWVPTDASEFGYRVDEVIAGVNVTAVGRSNEIDGLLTIEGTSATTVDIEVLVENITSDDPRRDGQFRGRIMSADEFPTATFELTEPIDFGEIPTDGDQVVAAAVGELTLRGVTNPVTFEVTAETNGERIGVLGSIPVVFEDYGIDNPSFGAIETEDDGLVEFVLVFERP